MTDDAQRLKADFEQAARVAVNSQPDAIWGNLHRMADAMAAIAEAGQRARAARRNSPEARKARTDAAQRGWETRRAREAAELAAFEDELARDAEIHARIGDGPFCDEMNHDSTGREVFCILDPDHGDDCEDVDGLTWRY
ncbi:hypothetical protein [Streptomyces sp. CB03911]|uniref:hypothetical protein n=1 Tax=Streptomyces sp. CB03911 TaxID=1804758 RepID=UPI00093F21B7|nr:hypothetical protein [Streptomyces sp. CB03911]OKI16580.1 hypothetical protein A6A07_11265 [Streptomyces sp. CB03911]